MEINAWLNRLRQLASTREGKKQQGVTYHDHALFEGQP